MFTRLRKVVVSQRVNFSWAWKTCLSNVLNVLFFVYLVKNFKTYKIKYKIICKVHMHVLYFNIVTSCNYATAEVNKHIIVIFLQLSLKILCMADIILLLSYTQMFYLFQYTKFVLIIPKLVSFRIFFHIFSRSIEGVSSVLINCIMTWMQSERRGL